tara:strand:- start:300 stop:2288 length:1989 start_codon:yes stop_codon:yes gene_type:complete
MKLKQQFVALFFLITLSTSTAFSKDHSGIDCASMPRLFNAYLNHHVQHRKLTAKIKQRTIKNYFDYLDSTKTVFLRKEFRQFKKDLKVMFTTMLLGSCGTLEKLQALQLQRAMANEAYVKKVLSDPKYKIDEKTEIISDPKKRKFALTEKARLNRLLKYVHFQMSGYIDSGEKMDESKKRLIHRYELITKRVKERTQSDIYSPFINSFALALDPHSTYFSSEDLENFRIGIELSLEGIGVSLSSVDGYATVEEIIPGGAADRLTSNKLKRKDKIIAVQQENKKKEDVIDMALRDVVKKIRGEKGSKVILTIRRQDNKKITHFETTIVRDKIDLKDQAAKLEVREVKSGGKTYRLGVLNLPSFYGDKDPEKRSSYRDIKKLLSEANTKKVDGLLLDLSRNGGGLLDDAVKISGLFMKKGGMVATQITHQKTDVLEDDDEDTEFNKPLVVFISRVSASASEILAGAVKDYKRGIIVGGDHTFGKGTVQTVLPLPMGLGAMKITTGMFFRPGGRSTQHTGVKSDVEIPSVLSMDDDLGEKYLDYSLPEKRIPAFVSKDANDTRAEKHWKPVKKSIVRKLARLSKKRVKKSTEFKKVEEDIKKAKEKKDVIKLADMRSDDKAKKDEKKDEEPNKKEEDTPQLKEAIQILADYINLVAPKTAVAQTP